MFGIGETEFIIIVVFAFLLFGPDKLPGMGRTLGRVLRQFRNASEGFNEVVQTNIMDPASEELEKSPKQRKREAQEMEAQVHEGDEGQDASEEGAATKEAPKRETFAERKARLMAERKAAEEAAAAQESADAASEGDSEPEPAGPQAKAGSNSGDVKTSDDVPLDEEVSSEPEPRPEPEPKRASAADLYSLGAQKSSRAQAKEAAEAAEEATVESTNDDSGEGVGEA